MCTYKEGQRRRKGESKQALAKFKKVQSLKKTTKPQKNTTQTTKHQTPNNNKNNHPRKKKYTTQH